MRALASDGSVVAAFGHEPNISAVAAILLDRTSHPALAKAAALEITSEGAVVIQASGTE